MRKAADAAIFIALCSWVAIALVCLMFVRTYFQWQSGGNQVIADYGGDSPGNGSVEKETGKNWERLRRIR